MTTPAPAAARETEGRPRSEAGDSCGIVPPHGAPVGVAGAPHHPRGSVAELLAAQVHPDKARRVAIARVLWPNIAERPLFEVFGLLGQIADVEIGHAAPWLSRKERERIEAEIKREERG